MTDSKQHSTTW